jgi:hypothetical protein
MKFSTMGLMAGLAASAAAEDLLFVDTFQLRNTWKQQPPLDIQLRWSLKLNGLA